MMPYSTNSFNSIKAKSISFSIPCLLKNDNRIFRYQFIFQPAPPTLCGSSQVALVVLRHSCRATLVRRTNVRPTTCASWSAPPAFPSCRPGGRVPSGPSVWSSPPVTPLAGKMIPSPFRQIKFGKQIIRKKKYWLGRNIGRKNPFLLSQVCLFIQSLNWFQCYISPFRSFKLVFLGINFRFNPQKDMYVYVMFSLFC